MTCTAIANHRGEHLTCTAATPHVNHSSYRYDVRNHVVWVGNAADANGIIRSCDLEHPHPGLAHSSSELQLLWTDPADETGNLTHDQNGRTHDQNGRTHVSAPTTPEAKYAAQCTPQTTERAIDALNDLPTNITVNRGGLQYVTSYEARPETNEPVTWNFTGNAAPGNLLVADGAGAASWAAPIPEPLIERVRSVRETYRSAGWEFTITDQEDRAGRRVVLDAFLPNSEAARA